MNKVLKRVSAMLCAGVIMGSFCVTSFATRRVTPEELASMVESGDTVKIKNDDRGNYVYQGGINAFNGKVCSSREETEKLENELPSKDYILFSEDSKDVSESDYNLFAKNVSGWYSQYLYDKDDSARDGITTEKFRVYFYKPSFDDAIEQLKNSKGSIEIYTGTELETSTVVINYMVWDEKEKAGKVVTDFNENIPETADAGYLKILSPIDCEIELEGMSDSALRRFYISADKPFLVKMYSDRYYIQHLNAMQMGESFRDDTLPYGKTSISIRTDNTKDNPYVLDLNDSVEKNDIQPVDITGKPDYSIDKNQSIPESETSVTETSEIESETDSSTGESVTVNNKGSNESTVLSESEAETISENQTNKTVIILCVILGALLIAAIVVIFRKNR